MGKIQSMDKFTLINDQAFDQVKLMREADNRARAFKRRELQAKKNAEREKVRSERLREKEERAALKIAKFHRLDARDGTLAFAPPAKNSYQKNQYRELVNIIKTAAVCTDCGKDWEPVALGFDHIPERGKKLFSISTGANRSLQELMEEMAKCELVCHSCHAIRTNKRIKQHHANEE